MVVVEKRSKVDRESGETVDKKKDDRRGVTGPRPSGIPCHAAGRLETQTTSYVIHIRRYNPYDTRKTFYDSLATAYQTICMAYDVGFVSIV